MSANSRADATDTLRIAINNARRVGVSIQEILSIVRTQVRDMPNGRNILRNYEKDFEQRENNN